MTIMDTIEADDFTIELHYDDDPINPREDYDAPGTLMVQLSDNYLAPSGSDAQDWRYDAIREAWTRARWGSKSLRDRSEEFVERYAKLCLGAAGVAFWDCPTDSSRIVVLVEAGSDFTHPHEAAKAIAQEYGDWSRGEVYGYVVTDAHGGTVESCWGYIGDSGLDAARSDAEHVVVAERAAIHAERVSLYRRLVNGRAA